MTKIIEIDDNGNEIVQRGMRIGPVRIHNNLHEVVPKRTWGESLLGGLIFIMICYGFVLYIINTNQL